MKMFSQYVGWMDHIRRYSVEKSSSRMSVQLMGSINAGWRSGFVALGRPPNAALPMILPGPTTPMWAASLA